MPKKVHYVEFLKTWNLRSNSVTRQVSFKIEHFKCDTSSHFQTTWDIPFFVLLLQNRSNLFSNHSIIVIKPINLCITHQWQIHQFGLKRNQTYGLKAQKWAIVFFGISQPRFLDDQQNSFQTNTTHASLVISGFIAESIAFTHGMLFRGVNTNLGRGFMDKSVGTNTMSSSMPIIEPHLI